MSQPLLFSLIDKAIYDYNLISDNDRLLIAASGGKDSTSLVEYFANRARRPDCNFTFKAVHIETEITKPLNENLQKLFLTWNVEAENIKEAFHFYSMPENIRDVIAQKCIQKQLQDKRNSLNSNF